MSLRVQYPTVRRMRVRRSPRTQRTHVHGGRAGRVMPTGSLAARLTRVALLLALVSALVFGAVQAGVPAARALRAAWVDWRRPDPVVMPVPVPGTRTVHGPVVEVVLLDSSSSMLKNDPDNERDAALRAYGRWLDRYGRSRDRFGVVRFFKDATSSGKVMPAQALTAGANGLAAVPSSGMTNLMPAVEQAERILRTAPSRSHRTALIITDGETADPAATGIARLRKVTDHVEVVALDRDNTWDSAQSAWKAPGVRLVEARNRRPNELGTELARSFLRSTGERAR